MTTLERRYALLDVTIPEAHVLTMSEVCSLLDISPKTLRRLLARGEIRGFKLSAAQRGHWRISETAIAKFIKKREEAKS